MFIDSSCTRGFLLRKVAGNVEQARVKAKENGGENELFFSGNHF